LRSRALSAAKLEAGISDHVCNIEEIVALL
jgi:hypothetical protein